VPHSAPVGTLFVLFGVVEVITHRNDTAGAVAFWGHAYRWVLRGVSVLERRRDDRAGDGVQTDME
jgi:hypothetical protein